MTAEHCDEHGWPTDVCGRCARCGHRQENHDIDDGCGACAMAMLAFRHDYQGRVVTAKARYRLVTTTDLYYHFVNTRSSGIAREHYTIRRADFWG